MFTDPVSVTYDSVGKSLAKVSGTKPGPKRVLASNCYRTADQEFTLFITQTQMADGVLRSEITLERCTQDPDGPFVGGYSRYPNRVGLVFEVNPQGYFASTDIGRLQTALLTLVDSTFRGRLIGGES